MNGFEFHFIVPVELLVIIVSILFINYAKTGQMIRIADFMEEAIWPLTCSPNRSKRNVGNSNH